ncbi:MAG: extracellular solute-binding protein [Bifidobacterium scardovii]|uniref:ABC transporter substrate-binding protein n=1 Tax=Bifidobacterium scardovii TaxID=158787 RepID=UPI000AB0E85C|nr:extracellular solute-binding protein [Bifidobacterium scardovii]MBS6948043.1 extracellular solute-binding protein [Bifidobacterium scardovii]MDU3736377.1 extracellular solute-binding protein [Bifidobacterium scardovii]MDU5296213.1 extracellular solute-binding protein [Bifidobacterium scardovii]MDU5610747.1 extracellular solute-binding protein [Bifidobacterium scardovii]MDU5885971.1 extracellular solute-binding protein [Bifidobacterium scardovii]
MKSKLKVFAASVAALAMVGSFAACGSGNDAQPSGGELKIGWYGSSDKDDLVTRAIALYKKDNPDVQIKPVYLNYDQMVKNAQLILQTDDAPDLVLYEQGTSTVGNLASLGVLSDMTDYAKQYGWDKILPESVQTIAKYQADNGGIMSEKGDWYGVPINGELGGMVYYNKGMFDQNGIKVPETFEELESALQQFVDKGITPIATDGAVNAEHLWYQLALTKADRQWVKDYQSFEHKVAWDSGPAKYAADTYAEWVNKGYIPNTAAAQTEEDMISQFCAGKFPVVITGSWEFGRVLKDATFAAVVKAFPGTEKLATGGAAKLWSIPESSKNKDAAAKFANFLLTNQDVQNMYATEGGLPLNHQGDPDLASLPDELKNPSGTYDKQQEQVTAFTGIFDSYLKNDALAYYPSWPAATMTDALHAALQGLINQRSNPDEALQVIEKAYDQGKKDLGVE